MIKTVSVAPMMDCTDKHEIYFLSLISKNVHLFTEMIVANAITRGDRSIHDGYRDMCARWIEMETLESRDHHHMRA